MEEKIKKLEFYVKIFKSFSCKDCKSHKFDFSDFCCANCRKSNSYLEISYHSLKDLTLEIINQEPNYFKILYILTILYPIQHLPFIHQLYETYDFKNGTEKFVKSFLIMKCISTDANYEDFMVDLYHKLYQLNLVNEHDYPAFLREHHIILSSEKQEKEISQRLIKQWPNFFTEKFHLPSKNVLFDNLKSKYQAAALLKDDTIAIDDTFVNYLSYLQLYFHEMGHVIIDVNLKAKWRDPIYYQILKEQIVARHFKAFYRENHDVFMEEYQADFLSIQYLSFFSNREEISKETLKRLILHIKDRCNAKSYTLYGSPININDVLLDIFMEHPEEFDNISSYGLEFIKRDNKIIKIPITEIKDNLKRVEEYLINLKKEAKEQKQPLYQYFNELPQESQREFIGYMNYKIYMKKTLQKLP